MTDVLSAARSYHARLKSELHRIDEFLRFAEELERRNAAAQQSASARPSVAAEMARSAQPNKHSEQPAAQAQAVKPEPAEIRAPQPMPLQASQTAPRASLFRGAFTAVGPADERNAA